MKRYLTYCAIFLGMSVWFFSIHSAQAAITFRSASSAVAAGSGNITLSMPAGTVANDVMIMAIVARDNVVITLPAGWTKFSELNNTTGLRSTMAWKRAVVGETGPYIVTHSAGNAIIGGIASYAGVITAGNPLDTSSTRANASSLTTTANSLTTTVDGSLIIFTSHYANDFTLGHGNTPYTCVSGPASFTERIDAETTLGLDASLAIADAVKTSLGATGTCTESMTGTATINIGAVTALKPEPPPSNQVTVDTALAQPTNVTEGATGVVMGAFSFISSLSAATVNSIKISEKGTVNANTNLSNGKLYAQQESPCTFAGATQIGTTQTFNAADEATFGSLGLSVGTALPQCVFVVLDVGVSAGGGNTIEIEITAVPDVSVSGGSIVGSFPVQIFGSTTIRADSGTVLSPEIDFDWVAGQSSWGETIWTTTETEGDIKLRVYHTVSTACDTIVPDSALLGNSTGFDVAQSPLDISGLNTVTYNRICLQATLTAGTSISPTLNSWTITWVPPAGVATFEQSAYRWFANDDATTVTTALAAQDTPATLTTPGQAFRFRMLIHVNSVPLGVSGQSFKLQFAQKSGTCGAYSDITAASSIAYNDNSPPDGASLTINGGLDPVHSGHTTVAETYEELNNFTNSIAAVPVGQDGLWDFALKIISAPSRTTYCIRAVKSDGSLLDTYSVTPELTTAVIYVVSGMYVSNMFDTGAPRSFGVIEWSESGCASCTIALQIRTSVDSSGAPASWSLWSGPDGKDADETDYFTVPSGELIHVDHNGDQWVQYRVVFTGDGSDTPILEEVKINYK